MEKKIPVVVIKELGETEKILSALRNYGIHCAEITFRTDAAAESIARITKAYPDMLIGAGTVLTPEQADSAVRAGAKFIVSPGFNPRVVKHCIAKGYPVVPGCSTCGEMEQAMELGLDVVKFFPAEASGGLPYSLLSSSAMR